MINYSSKLLEMEKDRISKLPDEILHHILSKVDVKEAVETSILSKRWKNLWSSLPNLSFSYIQLAKQCGVDSAWSCFMPRFTHFVIQFLSHRDHNSGIHKFQLSCPTLTDSRFVEKCLDYAINHGVEHLDLDAYCRPVPLKFPSVLLASNTLRVLELKQYMNSVVIPKPFTLSNLKTLNLENFTFKDVDDRYSFPKEPFSSFPNLEKLTLHCCEVSDLIISASKLKILEISFCDPLFSRGKKIEEISTPRLTSFRFEGNASLVCSKVDFPCLEEVHFDISPILESPCTDDIEKTMPLYTVGMLQQLGNAKFVTLTLNTIEVLEMDINLLEQSPSPFPHIKYLKLTKSPHIISRTKIVPPAVMNYLTKGSSYGDSLVVKFSEGIQV